jgi:ATP-dependent 26S proteasome regulatory subunit
MANIDIATEVEQYVKAGFPAIWVQSQEHEEAIKQLTLLCEKRKWEIGYWDADQGFKGSDNLTSQRTAEEIKKEPVWYDKKPLALIKDMQKLAQKSKAKRTLFILKNFHRRDFLENNAVLQAVPSKDQLWEIAQAIAHKSELPKTEDEKQTILDAAVGMTRRAAEGAFSLSIVKKKPFDAEIVQSLKAQAIKRRGLLTLYEGDDKFEDLGGLDHFKQYAMKLLGKRRHNPLLYPKGLLLLGVPGSGKSAAVKCLGNATGRPVLSLDVGALRSKFQGETDHNVRDALKIADAMSPCILFIDEIEKALSGVQSSGLTDGGTGARVFGSLLTWLNDHKSDVFFVGTCNDIAQLMSGNPEFARAERFDGMFFFDIPSEEERRAIWGIYTKMFELKKLPAIEELLKLSADWTGAEIRTCCRLSAVLDEPVAKTARMVVPIVRTASDRLDALRTWADGRCMSSSYEDLFKKDGLNTVKAIADTGSRKVSRD